MSSPPEPASDTPLLPAAVMCELLSLSRRWRAHVNRELRRLGQNELSYGALVEVCCSPDGVRQCEVSDRLGVTPSAVVHLLAELEALGLIERRPQPADRRAKMLFPTGRTAAALEQAHAHVGPAEARLFERLDAAELGRFAGTLARLSREIERL